MDVIINNLEFINELSEKNYQKLVKYEKDYLPFFNSKCLETDDRTIFIEKMHDFLYGYYSGFQKANSKGRLAIGNDKKINNMAAFLQTELLMLYNSLDIFEESTKKHPVSSEYRNKSIMLVLNIYNKDSHTYSITSVFEYIRLMNCAVNSYLKCKRKITDEDFVFDYNEEVSDKVMSFILTTNKSKIMENDFYNAGRFACVMYALYSVVLLDRLEKEGLYD